MLARGLDFNVLELGSVAKCCNKAINPGFYKSLKSIYLGLDAASEVSLGYTEHTYLFSIQYYTT